VCEAAAEDIHQRRRHARRLGARRHVLKPAHGRLGTQIAAAFRRMPDRQLEQRIAAPGVAIIGVLVTASDGQHAKAQHLGQPVRHHRRIALVAQASGQKVGQAEAAFRLAQQHQAAVQRNQATVERRRHFLAANGWKIEGKKAIVCHGGCGNSVARVERRFDIEFLHDSNELRYIRQLKIMLGLNNPS